MQACVAYRAAVAAAAAGGCRRGEGPGGGSAGCRARRAVEDVAEGLVVEERLRVESFDVFSITASLLRQIAEQPPETKQVDKEILREIRNASA